MATTAVYSGTYTAPYCSSNASPCETGSTVANSIVRGRLTIGPEPNYSNTVNTCNDGGTGVYHSDESIDMLKLEKSGGGAFTSGSSVRVVATVWCFGTTNDYIEIYYGGNVNSPSFGTPIYSTTCPATGQQTITSSYFTLTSSAVNQIIRAQFNYSAAGGSNSCLTGNYNDRDDLVFKAVNAAPQCVGPTSIINGRTYYRDSNGNYNYILATDLL